MTASSTGATWPADYSQAWTLAGPVERCGVCRESCCHDGLQHGGDLAG